MRTTRQIGGRQVGPIGFGGLALSVDDRPDRRDALAVIRCALDSGMTLIDTADCYCLGPDDTGHNERLIAEAIASWAGRPDEVLVATKGGQRRAADGRYLIDARPSQLRAACEASLRSLRREPIDLYQLHAVDPAVPFLESVGALGELRAEGKIAMIGLSNVTLSQIEAARALVPIVSVQNRFSPSHRECQAELSFCAQTGIAFLPWGPLGGLAAHGREPAGLASFMTVARARGWSVQRACLAWLLALAPVVIPIPGAGSVASVLDSALAGKSWLTASEIALLGGIEPP